jgi:hypothetical protein
MTDPQHPPKPKPSPASKSRRGVKSLLATVSLAATLGGWAMLAAERAPAKTAQAADVAPPRMDAAADVAVGFPPLPTLVPPLTDSSSLAAPPAEIVQPTPAPQPTLRAAQPPPQRVVHVGGGGNGGNGGSGGAAPAAQTSSSR